MNQSDIIKIVIDSLFSFSALLLSIVVYLNSKRVNKTNFEMGIYQQIQEAKINLDNQIRSIGNETKEFDDETTNDYLKHTIPAPIETYLNSLDHACVLYYSKEISREHFRLMFTQDITTIFTSDVYKSILYSKGPAFINLKRFYIDIISTGRRGKHYGRYVF